MAVSGPFKVDCGELFPHGLVIISEVDSLDDFDKSTKDNRVQARDKDTGLPMWQVEVLDFDPKAREKTFRVKIAAAVQPVPPEALPGCSGPSGGAGGADGHALHQGGQPRPQDRPTRLRVHRPGSSGSPGRDRRRRSAMTTSFVGRRVPAETLRIRKEPSAAPSAAADLVVAAETGGAAAAGHCRVSGGCDHADGSHADVGGLPAGQPAVGGGRLPGAGRGAGRASGSAGRRSSSAGFGCRCGRGGGAGRSTATSGRPRWISRS